MSDKTKVGYAAFNDGTGELIVRHNSDEVTLQLTPSQIELLNSIKFPMCVHVEVEPMS